MSEEKIACCVDGGLSKYLKRSLEEVCRNNHIDGLVGGLRHRANEFEYYIKQYKNCFGPENKRRNLEQRIDMCNALSESAHRLLALHVYELASSKDGEFSIYERGMERFWDYERSRWRDRRW